MSGWLLLLLLLAAPQMVTPDQIQEQHSCLTCPRSDFYRFSRRCRRSGSVVRGLSVAGQARVCVVCFLPSRARRRAEHRRPEHVAPSLHG